MDKMPLISIIIPVYNVEKWLDECVKSVLSQAYSNLEIILVDDGSKDSSGALCDQWATQEPRIRVIHKKNGGLSSARNAGLDCATGEYVLFLDSDDLIHPQICSKLYDCIEQTQADIAICDLVHVFGTDAPAYTLSEEMRTLTPLEAIEELWYQKSFLPSACAKLYRRALFAQLRFTENLLYEDVDLMHLLFWQASSIVYNPSGLYGYTHREDSITTHAFSKRDLDILTIAEKLLQFSKTTEPRLAPAARAYAVVAAMRVELNAPKTEELAQGRAQARELLASYGKQVLKDPGIRKKTRYGLMLYFYCRPLMKLIYKGVNRWK